MNNSFLIAVYDSGKIINLNGFSNLSGSEISAIINCAYENTTSSKQNDYYSYSVFDKNLNPVISNSFVIDGFTCKIDSRDKWSQPVNNWSGGHHYEMRVSVTITDAKGEAIVVNLRHSSHKGEAFESLTEILLIAKNRSLAEALREFIKNSK
jgi:hypothetical protein